MSDEIKDVVEETVVETPAEAPAEAAEETAAVSVWDKFEEMRKSNTLITVEISGAVKGGVIAYVDGVRGFIPASQLSTKYEENLESWISKTVDVIIIEAKEEEKRLILSGKKAARRAKYDSIKEGDVLEGTVESLQDYGAFIDLGDRISGLVHISQISNERIGKPSDVLSVGDKVTVRVLKNDKKKISLSMKDPSAAPAAKEGGERERKPRRERNASRGEQSYHDKDGNIATSLGDLLKDVQL